MSALGEGSREHGRHADMTKEDRETRALPASPSCWSSAGLSEEPPTDMCNQPHPHVSLSLSASLANVSA